MANEARDAVATAPHVYTALFENERIRLLEVTMQPGDRSELHEHPDSINYVMTAGTLRFSLPDGTNLDAEFQPGQAVWQPALAHAVENIGSTDVKAVMVELKA